MIARPCTSRCRMESPLSDRPLAHVQTLSRISVAFRLRRGECEDLPGGIHSPHAAAAANADGREGPGNLVKE